MNAALLKAIGPSDLTGYFEYLDDLRDSGKTNMYGARSYLMRKYRGMGQDEAGAVLSAWMKTFSHSLPPEDRADKALSSDDRTT